ncbi:MAG: flagellar hook capping FlgD N-terminal domain-containing protein [Lachnospiraceae bacterium]|nr:flagellar hook capping FlgD N-terminal domain-containing protein [Lachnospiraceae bacterium]
MSVIAPVVDGQVVATGSSAESTTEKTNGSTLDKDSFLQLLVAEMKYQDPLEPTSNTEYIAQYASFSQVESLQNMEETIELQRAQALVGQTVIMAPTDSNGETSYVTGIVDYVTIENGKGYLFVKGNSYSLDDLEEVVNPTYLDAYNKAVEFMTGMTKLPTAANLTLDNEEAVNALKTLYEGMSDYEKSFISDDDVKTYESYVAKIEELLKGKELEDEEKK